MKGSVDNMTRIGKILVVLFASTTFMLGCAEFDRITKPKVRGLQQAVNFDQSALIEGGIGNTQLSSSLKSGDEINIEALQPTLAASIRSKRRDIDVSSDGLYQISADIIADDISRRESDLDTALYKYTKRRVKVNYTIIDSSTDEHVWSGIIETYEEALASYEKTGKEKSSDAIVEAVTEAVTKKELRPYPDAPFFGDVLKLNFDGFALNLPYEK